MHNLKLLNSWLWRTCRILRLPTISLLAAVCVLSSCSLLSLFKSNNSLSAIQLVAEINANQNTATNIDIAFIYDEQAVALLPKTGPEWFEKKPALMLSMATSIEVVSLQMPPATLASVSLPARHAKAVGVYCFVNYLNVSGQAVGNLTPYTNMVIWLTPNTLLYKGD